MPRLSTVATVSTTTEVRLEPRLAKKLRTEFKLYQELSTQKKAIEAAMDKHKAIIGALRDETGEMSIKLDGFTTTLCGGGTRKTLNHKKLIGLGCAAAWIEEATEEKPTKSFEKVTCPNNGKDEEED